ncbi:hypothetical protein C1645_839245 [Glomus cerebriforme]|uniref:Uncharacterized protein n=1 Tax=Glomus cerebriforme TaxID=658196 RepID=A0A397S3R7_9GLOM|nr:hypothetical protein C1645_839245 [Glomus cerebriforme]
MRSIPKTTAMRAHGEKTPRQDKIKQEHKKNGHLLGAISSKSLGNFLRNTRPVIGNGRIWEETPQKEDDSSYIDQINDERDVYEDGMDDEYNFYEYDMGSKSMDTWMSKIFDEETPVREIPIWWYERGHPEIRKDSMELPDSQTPDHVDNSNELITKPHSCTITMFSSPKGCNPNCVQITTGGTNTKHKYSEFEQIENKRDRRSLALNYCNGLSLPCPGVSTKMLSSGIYNTILLGEPISTIEITATPSL